MKEITVNKNDANQRLDKFLSKYLKSMPQSMLYKGLRKNCVRVNNSHVRDGGFILSEGDRLKLYFKDEFFTESTDFSVSEESLDVIYEDENIILINKSAGVVVHADDRGSSDTLVARLQSYLYKKGEYNPQEEHTFSPAFCNRLDRNTSGIIIGAKNAAALRIVNEKIRTREIKKLYLCIVEGTLPESGTLRANLTRGDKKVRITDKKTDASKSVSTKYKVIASHNSLSLVKAELETGRTHQIRAQFAHIGHPLAGDSKYGSHIKCPLRLASYKLRFHFTSDAGILNYLRGREFQISVDFASTFMQQKL